MTIVLQEALTTTQRVRLNKSFPHKDAITTQIGMLYFLTLHS